MTPSGAKSHQDLVGVYDTTEVVLFTGPSLGIDPRLGTGRNSGPVGAWKIVVWKSRVKEEE